MTAQPHSSGREALIPATRQRSHGPCNDNTSCCYELEKQQQRPNKKRNNNLFNNAETMINNVVCGFVVVSGNKQTKETTVNNST